MLRSLALASALILISAPSYASQGVIGYWQEPTGSVIHVAPCGEYVCATLVALNPNAPEKTDGMNPDPRSRSRPLCGLLIGQHFTADDRRADGGTLYDPKSGKTYRGTMTAEGTTLALRGYVGIKMFGRTEHWTRVAPVPTCGTHP